MGQAVRNPDRALVDRIRALEATVATQQRLPSGANSIGWGYVPLEAPRGTLSSGYAQVTANQTGITTSTDLTSLSVTVTVGASRRLRITANARLSGTVADGLTFLTILQDGGAVNQGAYPRVAGGDQNVTLIAVSTPSTGSHTYKLNMARGTGTGTVGISAGAGFPAYILVEDIGSA